MSDPRSTPLGTVTTSWEEFPPQGGFVSAQWPEEPPCETKSLTWVGTRTLSGGALLEIITVFSFGESFFLLEDGGGGDPELGLRRSVSHHVCHWGQTSGCHRDLIYTAGPRKLSSSHSMSISDSIVIS